ncbi:hypothetical protein BT69DRAFT_1306156, partial [Atractiella rhizophila]
MSSLSPTLTASSIGPSPSSSPRLGQLSDIGYASASSSFNSGTTYLTYTPYFTLPSYPNFEDILDGLLNSAKGADDQIAVQQLMGYLTTSYLHYSPSTFETFYSSKFLGSVRPLLSAPRATARLVGLKCLELLLDILSSASDYSPMRGLLLRRLHRGRWATRFISGASRERERESSIDEEGWKVTEEAGKNKAKLCRLGGTSMIEQAKAQLKTSIEWLQDFSTRKVPNVVWSEATELVDNLWIALVDPLVCRRWPIRVSAAKAMRAVLSLANEREKKQPILKEMVLKQATEIISTASPSWTASLTRARTRTKMKDPSEVHGGVLAIEQLWKTCAGFMTQHYTSTMTILLDLRESTDAVIRRTVLDVVPILVEHNAQEFCKNPPDSTWLHKWMVWFLGQISRGVDRGACKAIPRYIGGFADFVCPGFKTVGIIADIVGDEMSEWLDRILEQMNLRLRPPETGPTSRTLTTPSKEEECIFNCITGITLSLAHHPQLCGQLPTLIDLMGTYELSPGLQQAYLFLCNMQLKEPFGDLQRIVTLVRARTLDAISLILTGDRFEYPGAPQDWFDSTDFPISYTLISRLPTPTYSPQKRIEIITLALDTLLSCDFGEDVSLQQFLHEWITLYLDDEDPQIRTAAAECCCELLVSDQVVNRKSKNSIQVCKDVGDKVVYLAVRDGDPTVRLKAMNAIRPELDRTLAQADV